MTYVLYGTEEFLLKREIQKIISKNKIEQYDINYYNLEEDDLKSILEDASTISLFSNQRIIIIENSYIFTGASKKTQDTKYLENYLKEKNHNNIIIFTVISDKLDSRKKIVTLASELGTVMKLDTNNHLNSIVKDLFGNYQINNSEIDLLIERVGDNLSLLDQEIEKIKVYKNDDLEITKEDILNLTTKAIDTNIFHLIDNIISNRKQQAMESYLEMIKLGEEPIKIIVMLANQFRLMLQTKLLKKQGVSIYEMMSILGQKKFPLEKAIEKGRNISEESLFDFLKQLSDLDMNIKTGKIDKNIGLEIFILTYDEKKK